MAGSRGEAVRALFNEAGYLDVETCRDYGDNERLTLGRWPHKEQSRRMNLFTAVLYLHIACVVTSVGLFRAALLVDLQRQRDAQPALGAYRAAL